jgi:hypothetical protein
VRVRGIVYTSAVVVEIAIWPGQYHSSQNVFKVNVNVVRQLADGACRRNFEQNPD